MSNWREVAMDRVHEHLDPAPTIRPGRRPTRSNAVFASVFDGQVFRVHLHTTTAMVALIDRCAKARGVNRSTFVRRAVALLIAADQDMPIRSVLWHSPSEGPYGGHQANRGQRDHGDGIETWCPHPGCDGSHLR